MNPSTGTGRARAALALVLLLAVLVRLPSILTGYPASSDVQSYKEWGQIIASRGLEHAYDGTRAMYPPLLLYVMGAAANVEATLQQSDLYAKSDGALVALVLQIITALADLLTAALLATIIWPRAPTLAVLVAAFYAFSPVVIYLTAVWGQTDSIYTLFLVAAILALERGALLPAWLIYALALATKLQSIALAPLMLARSLARHGLRGLLIGLILAGTTLALLCAPWLLSGHAADLLRPYTSPGEGRTVVSAYNTWYLLFGGDLTVSSELQPPGLPLTYRTIGNTLFVLLAVVVTWVAIRRNSGLALPSAVLALGIFLVLTDIHERHAYAALAFLLWAAAERSVKHTNSQIDDPSPPKPRPNM